MIMNCDKKLLSRNRKRRIGRKIKVDDKIRSLLNKIMIKLKN